MNKTIHQELDKDNAFFCIQCIVLKNLGKDELIKF